MAADQLVICPQCAEKREEEITALKKQVDDMYGKVTSYVYQEMSNRLTTLINAPAPMTLEINEDNGVETNYNGYISFNAGCRTCGFITRLSGDFDTRSPAGIINGEVAALLYACIEFKVTAAASQEALKILTEIVDKDDVFKIAKEKDWFIWREESNE